LNRQKPRNLTKTGRYFKIEHRKDGYLATIYESDKRFVAWELYEDKDKAHKWASYKCANTKPLDPPREREETMWLKREEQLRGMFLSLQPKHVVGPWNPSYILTREDREFHGR